MKQLLQIDEMKILVDESGNKFVKCPHKDPTGMCSNCNTTENVSKCMAALASHNHGNLHQ